MRKLKTQLESTLSIICRLGIGSGHAYFYSISSWVGYPPLDTPNMYYLVNLIYEIVYEKYLRNILRKGILTHELSCKRLFVLVCETNLWYVFWIDFCKKNWFVKDYLFWCVKPIVIWTGQGLSITRWCKSRENYLWSLLLLVCISQKLSVAWWCKSCESHSSGLLL